MLRAAAESLMPPFAFRFARKLWQRAHGLGGTTFEGAYPSFEATGCDASAYDDDEIAEAAIRAAIAGLQSSADRREPPISDNSGQLLLPAVASQIKGDYALLDFGGGPARGLLNLKSYGRSIEPKRYVLVETPAIVRAFHRSCPEIEAREDIPRQLPKPLVINAASAIQYIDRYRETLKKFLDLSPDTFIISQVSLSGLPTYARVQLNIPHKRIPVWVLNEREFADCMSGAGYRLKLSVDHDLPHSHRNAPGPSRMVSMIFTQSVNRA